MGKSTFTAILFVLLGDLLWLTADVGDRVNRHERIGVEPIQKRHELLVSVLRHDGQDLIVGSMVWPRSHGRSWRRCAGR